MFIFLTSKCQELSYKRFSTESVETFAVIEIGIRPLAQVTKVFARRVQNLPCWLLASRHYIETPMKSRKLTGQTLLLRLRDQ